jgi:pimeloyl-ACP methyl ester carboxylesterase
MRRPSASSAHGAVVGRRGGVLPLAVTLAAVASFGAAADDAAARLAFCGPAPRECVRVVVPLDRSARVGGELGLQVERQRARRAVRPPLVMVAPPGLAATQVFDAATVQTLVRAETGGRDVVLFDERGTGASAVIRCRPLERVDRRIQPTSLAAAAAVCARRLGVRRPFYTTSDSVEDLEAVRAAIGAPRIAVLAVSAGSEVALEYARRHREHLERLVLDSPVAPGGSDPLYRTAFAAAPRVMRNFCAAGACRPVTHHAVRDLRRLAARVRRRALRGHVFDGSGRLRAAAVGPFELFELVADEDTRSGVPAALRAALAGDTAPIFRAKGLARLGRIAARPGPEVDSVGAAVARACEDSQLPWARSAPMAARMAQARAFVGELGPHAFGVFGPGAALASDVVALCLRWPSDLTSPTRSAAALPAVPTLVLSGDEDLQTPREDARRVVGQIAGSRLLPMSGAGHDVLFHERSACASRAVRAFLALAHVPGCPRPRDWVSVVDVAFPRTLRELRRFRGVPGRAGRTLTAMRLTLADLSKTTYGAVVDTILSDATVRVGGLRGGRAAAGANPDRLHLERVTFVPGVRVSGTISGFVLGIRLRGRLKISGRGAAPGTLVVRGRKLTGRLGGRRIEARMALDQDSLAAADEVP